MFRHVVKMQRLMLAEDNYSQLASEQTLACAYYAVGTVKEAVHIQKNVVADRDRMLPDDHPDRQASQQWLDLMYRGG